jgi:hypothetical protein
MQSNQKFKHFFCPSPLPFGGSTVLESYSRTSGESNHHRQSVSATTLTPYQLSHEGDKKKTEIKKKTKKNKFKHARNRTQDKQVAFKE